jgi:hypothetical protein
MYVCNGSGETGVHKLSKSSIVLHTGMLCSVKPNIAKSKKLQVKAVNFIYNNNSEEKLLYLPK